jgi:hypothetical protein
MEMYENCNRLQKQKIPAHFAAPEPGRIVGNYSYLSVMQFTKPLLLLGLAMIFCPACHEDGAKPAPPALSSTKTISADGSVKMTIQAYGPGSVCIIDEDGVIYHPAESGEY